ncbi:phosphatase [Fusibacter sp. 3D3]|uniref:phosphatase n=1 Tax=Fusibacter sp. 3D3 TaxID=1048380 RepID=UPI0008534EA4|nr:phosphatase [Fusibacter sp. 3D3]GAU79018.1 putative histidinol phosphatase and related hydrolases of the PHP family [Fusibacter sp. 3D3]
MRYILDLHTHTVASGHAYSTLNENILAAKNKGLKLLGVSDHAPKMPGSTQEYYFGNLKVLPEVIEGLRVLKGVELNILNSAGAIDLSDQDMKHLDYAIASLHIPCFENLGATENTNALINAMKHPKVNIIGHPDDARYPLEYERLVIAAKAHNVLLEINNSSLAPVAVRENARENYITLLALCEKHQAAVIFGSDAHYISDIGNFSNVEALVEAVNFPKNLIVNNDINRLWSYLNHSKEV